MRHILSRTSDPPDLLGTCGSGFSGSYLYLLEDKDVVLLFDNDDAGQSGVKSIARRVKSSGHNIKSLQYLDWSQITVSQHAVIPNKYDLRDLYNDLNV
jgi:5S rRNA maturation endonuclease (ribonuclease M5)